MYLCIYFSHILISIKDSSDDGKQPWNKNHNTSFHIPNMHLLVSGLHQTSSFRFLELEKKNLRNSRGQLPHLIDGETVLKTCQKQRLGN